MRHDQLSSILEFAVEVAHHAGKLTLEYFRTGVVAETKDDDSPVTVADRRAERECRRLIEARFPDDGILGEEYGETRAGARRRWVLDPIDGTRSFVRGVPLYGVMIALEEGSIDLLGVLYFPAMNETVAAARGEGCWNDGARARVSSVGDLGRALLLTTDTERIAASGHGARWEAMARRVELVRTWGDCYGHMLVATGRAEAMVDPILAPWDAAPLRVIVEEAGGVFTDWHGVRTHRSAAGISTNAALADEVRACLGVPAPRLPGGSDAAS